MASGEFEKYGVRWAKGTSDLVIELWACRTKHPKELGGLGYERHFRNAYAIAWPKFIWHDWMEMLMTAWCTEKFFTVIGHTRATKTYGVAHLGYLDYCVNPLETWTSLTTVTFDGLKSRMWSDLMTAVETASFKCPFKVTTNTSEMKMRVPNKHSRKDDKYMMEGFATSKTADSAGRIQGKHANRRRLLLDEAQELPDAIWTAEVNAAGAPDFISGRLANPVDKQTRFGRECCEPIGGWSSIHDTDLYWRTKAGHLVLHFDGLQNYNSKLFFRFERGEISRKTYEEKRLPFMLTHERIEEIRLRPGEDSLEWWMNVRGFFPGDGIVSRCFPDLFLERMEQDLIFDFPPTPCFLEDPAYEHDECVGHHAVYGRTRDGTVGMQFKRTVVCPIKVSGTEKTKDEQIAEWAEKECREAGVKPEDYMQDRTGNGRSVWSHMSKNFGRGVHGVEFGGKPTDRALVSGEDKKCEDLFKYFIDELHFRAAAWAKSGRFGGLKNLSVRTREDLAARRYTIYEKKQRVEDKAAVKKRLGRSPDHGDAFILGGELLARKGHFPGKASDVPAPGKKWETERKAAIKAGRRHDEAQEFGFH